MTSIPSHYWAITPLRSEMKGTIMNQVLDEKQYKGNSVLQMLVEALESLFIPRRGRRHVRCSA